MFKINEKTTWWSPKPEYVIDARDISGLKVSNVPGEDGTYWLEITYSGCGTNEKHNSFKYKSLGELNNVLKPLGLEWQNVIQCPILTT